ncbi:MAG: hypothetical protein ACI83H_001161 [Glaciecola sp.]|jgi:hypothetical protein
MKITIKHSILVTFLLVSKSIFSQAEIIFNNVHFDESTSQVEQKLSLIATLDNKITVDKPTFPLASNQETHLIYSNIKTANGTINKVAFTFSDNKLSYIQANGNIYKTFVEKRKDTARAYMDYEVYVKDKLFIKEKEDVAWILTSEGMHTGLFAWRNPYLNENYSVKLNTGTNIPEFIEMGGALEVLKPILELNSEFTYIEKLDDSDPNAQLQINCFGVDYLGFPRKIEARFGNKKLNVVWILTAKAEEDRIRKALINQYGKPIFVNDDWEIFNNWQVALRKDKPEVLLMEQNIGLEYKSSYFKQ